MQITIEFDANQLQSVTTRLREIGANVPKVLAAAVNDTAKQQKTKISSRLRERVNIKKKDIDPHINFSRATPANPSCVLTLSKTKRLSLKYFAARQNKRGVTYQVSKVGGRKSIAHAFILKVLGGHVFERLGPPRPAKKGRYKGKMRQAIVKLFGPSPWGVFVKSGLEAETLTTAQEDLHDNLEHRVKFELLKKSGAIKH